MLYLKHGGLNMADKNHLDKLKEILDRKCNLQYDLEIDEMQAIDEELRKLYNLGDTDGKS
jgi:uncharacterized protein YfkK (UPF0435 family)